LISLLLALCLVPSAARATESAVDIRLYSLHKVQYVNLQPDGDGVRLGEWQLKGAEKISVRGQYVGMEGPLKAGPERALKISAGASGVWLSGPGLPRRLYTGQLVFTSDKRQLKIINSVPIEPYVAGVVTGEASDLSQPEAYKAQAVAARTYIFRHLKNHAGEGYNLCDSTHCQLYTGQGSISEKARLASEATRGEILYYKGEPAYTYYHSICGGRTEAPQYVWPYGGEPYLVSVRDGPPGRPYCSIAPDFRWKTIIYYTGLTRLARQAGWLAPGEEAKGLRISAWTPSGRAYQLEILTPSRKVMVSATDFYQGIGRRAGWRAVRSTYFTVLTTKDYVMLDGVGSGHGVGLCQWGAEGMARQGFKYKDILRHYYPGTELKHD
jgi:stage II sporulation protein D